MNLMATMRARIRRRLLITYRVDPVAITDLLPEGFRPHLVNGYAVAGICLIGLDNMRPGFVKPDIGLSAENAAHRIAVAWDDGGQERTGVYIPERHSSGRAPVLAGGRIFPGVHEPARVSTQESDDRIRIRLDADSVHLYADVTVPGAWTSELFPTVDDASAFFRAGAVGWSPTRDGGIERVRLDTDTWEVQPATPVEIRSSMFDALPPGAAALDDVLVMRNISSTWRALA